MTAENAMRPEKPRQDRLVVALLLIAMAFGCFLLVLGVPGLVLWVVSVLTDSSLTHFVVSLVLVPIAILLFAWPLGQLNRLYLDVSGAASAAGEGVRLKGPLESMLVGTLVLAIVGLAVWFVLFADGPVVGPFV